MADGPFHSLVRPREPFVELPSLGAPTEAERDWRRTIARGSMREHWQARIRAITFEEWGHHLAGADLEWALRAVRYLKHILARHEERIIRTAFEQDWGWDKIGSYLGVSRQAVAQRWGPRLAPTDPRPDDAKPV